jgi:hypothetical protein
VLASLAMLVRDGARCAWAPGGSAPPIPSEARRGLGGAARSGRESRLADRTGKQDCEVVARTMLSRSGLRVTTPTGGEF